MPMIRFLIIILLAIFSPQKSFAGFSVSATTLYQNVNSSDYEFVNQGELDPSISIGYFSLKDNIFFGVSTNRLTATHNKRSIKIGNNTYNSYSYLKYDSMQLGFKIKNVIPSLLIANTTVERDVPQLNSYKSNTTITYGLNLSYFLAKNTSLSAIYIAPNKELELDSAFGLGINFFY